MKLILVAASLAIAAGTASAATKVVTLSVPTMDCPACPITLKKALGKMPGVERVDVSYARRQAVVVYDDLSTSVDALMRATRNAGYPSVPTGDSR